MKKYFLTIATALSGLAVHAQLADTTAIALDNVVVTGTRNATDVRHLPMTISVVGREKTNREPAHQRAADAGRTGSRTLCYITLDDGIWG